MLALTFANPADYDKILEDDVFNILGLEAFTPGNPLILKILHTGGKTEEIPLNHTYSELQINWFKAGSALNFMKEK